MNMQQTDPTDDMKRFYGHCIKSFKSFEIWPGYFERRFKEFEKFYSLFPQKNFSHTLEIGCGIGYQSALLSFISEKVIATDVDFGNMQKHSRGIDIAKKFISATERTNVNVVEANAEKLPFNNNSFDFIYCSYSFQYIRDKARALKEINRVLTDDGYFFCVLPTAADRIGASFKYYCSIIKKVFQKTFNKNDQHQIEGSVTEQKKIPKLNKLIPPVDDEDNSFLKEIFSRFPFRWKKLFLLNKCHIKYVYHTAGSCHLRKNFFPRFVDSLHSAGLILICKKIV